MVNQELNNYIIEGKASIVIFGSYIRKNDYDVYSDRDLLILGDNINCNKFIANVFNSYGWNCSIYSYYKFNYLKLQGSLFLQHLKQESHILYDYNDNFNNFIHDYKLPCSFNNEIENAIKLLSPVEYFSHNNSLILNYYLLDVLYVFLRNYGIHVLAHDGIIEFSYPNIIKILSKKFNLSNKSMYQLLQLRVMKHRYRNRKIKYINDEYIENIIRIIDTKLKLYYFSGFTCNKTYSLNLYDKLFSNGKIRYNNIRYLEALLLNSPTLNKHKSLWNIVINPQEFIYTIDIPVKINKLT